MAPRPAHANVKLTTADGTGVSLSVSRGGLASLAAGPVRFVFDATDARALAAALTAAAVLLDGASRVR